MDAGDPAGDGSQRRVDLRLEHIAVFDHIDDMGPAAPLSDQPRTRAQASTLACWHCHSCRSTTFGNRFVAPCHVESRIRCVTHWPVADVSFVLDPADGGPEQATRLGGQSAETLCLQMPGSGSDQQVAAHALGRLGTVNLGQRTASSSRARSPSAATTCSGFLRLARTVSSPRRLRCGSAAPHPCPSRWSG